MIGALTAVGDIPAGREDFAAVISRTLPEGKIDDNMAAFDLGVEMLKKAS